MKKISLILSLVFVICFFAFASQVSAGTVDLKGYAWSSNIGWISFNSLNTNAGNGGTYAVKMTTSSDMGILSGYAWSPNIGWVSFEPTHVAGCNPAPAEGCQAKINLTSGKVTGWARAVAGIGRSDGWDGWIELSGTNHTSPNGGGIKYAITGTTGTFSGYAWGSDVVGWVSFDLSGSGDGVKCIGPGCVPDINSSKIFFKAKKASNSVNTDSSYVLSLTVNKDEPIVLRWRPENLTNCNQFDGDWDDLQDSTAVKNKIKADNTEDINTSFTKTGQKDLAITCDKIYGLGKISSTISILVNNSGSGYCSPKPQNSTICPQFVDYTPNSGVRESGLIDSCPLNDNDQYICKYVCPSGLKQNKAGTKCVSPSSLEEF